MEKLLKQIDDIFDNIEILVDNNEEVVYGHINGTPIFKIYNNIFDNTVIGFFRNTSNILFYAVGYSKPLKDYVKKKLEDVYDLLDYPVEEIEETDVFNFNTGTNQFFLEKYKSFMGESD